MRPELWELALAGLVFVLATLPVLTLFTQGGRERRQGADHALALGLAWRVAEELGAEAADDPHAPARRARKPEVAAGWPDGEPAPAAWSALSGFGAQLAARSEGERLDFSVTLGWEEQGDERELTLAFALPAERPATDVAPGVGDAAIGASLFPGEPGTLAEVVARRGADPARVRALGEVCVRLAERDGLAAGDAGDARAAFAAAVALEAGAARRVTAMVRLAGPLGDVVAAGDAALGRPAPAACSAAAERVAALPGELAAALAGALAGFARVADSPAAPPRVRVGALRRAVDAGSLLALTGEPRALAVVQELLDRAIPRAGPLASWARSERAAAASLTTLMASYGAPARLEALATYDRVMVRARSRLLSLACK